VVHHRIHSVHQQAHAKVSDFFFSPVLLSFQYKRLKMTINNWQHWRPAGAIRQDLRQTVDETWTVLRGHVHRMAAVQDRVQNQDEHGKWRGSGVCFDFRFGDITILAFRYFQLTVIAGWTISSAVLCSLIFGLHQMDLHPVAAAAYSSLSHTLWALCLSWTVIACATGHGGKSHSIVTNACVHHTPTHTQFRIFLTIIVPIVSIHNSTPSKLDLPVKYIIMYNNDDIIWFTGYINKLLSCKILIPFSRTTYCAYLVHPIIIRYVVMKRDTPLHLTVETVVRILCIV